MEDPVGAFCPYHGEVVRAGVREGPLRGLRFAAKDLYDVEGVVTGGGNPDWLRTHAPAERNAWAVQALLDAGAELVGKTLTDELAFSLAGENHYYGTPRNVNAPGRIPGGSSSGSAAAVAADLVDFALGTDTGGSIRIPASFCGLYGLRPTHGAISADGVLPLAPSFDTVGWFTRSAELLLKVGAALLPARAARERPARLLYAREVFAEALPDARAELDRAAAQVARRLGPLDEVDFVPEGFETWLRHFQALQWREIWETFGEWIAEAQPAFGPGVAERFAATRTVSDAQVAEAGAFRTEVERRVDQLLSGGAVMVLPSAPMIAPRCGLPQEDMVPFRTRCLGVLSISCLARTPQLSMPLGTVDDCPIGLSLMGARGSDRLLLAAAKALAD